MSAPVNKIPPEIVRTLLDYDRETGLFRWKPRTADMFECGRYSPERECRRWNSRFAGTPVHLREERDGYLRTFFLGKKFFAHRLAWACETGRWPLVNLDHINGDRKDNRICNLRECDAHQNMENRRKSGGTSRYMGVSWHKGAWNASIKKGRKNYYLGRFVTEEAAAAAYAKAKAELHTFNPIVRQENAP